MAAGVLVGRSIEIRRLDGLLRRVRGGNAATLVVTGTAGVGKSALLADLRARAADAGFAVLHAEGVELERDLPFGALSGLLRPLLAGEAPTDASLAAAFGLDDRPAAALGVYNATLSLLAGLADRRPVLVVVDDAHWIDRESLAALAFVAHRLTVERVGVVFSQRTGDATPLDETRFDRFELDGLPDDDAVALLARQGVARSVATRCWELTGGNPLGLLEATRALTEDQRRGRAELPPVATLAGRALHPFESALRPLPEGTLDALEVAALEADGDLNVVVRALPRLGRDVSDLVAAEEAGVIHLVDGRVHWRHPLVRAAVHTRAAPELVRAAHRALAEAHAGGDDERRLWHLAEGTVGPDAALAASFEEAAKRSVRRGALPAAARAFERAAQLSPDPGRRNRLVLAGAHARWVSGELQPALARLEPLARRTEDPRLAAQTACVLAEIETWVSGPRIARARLGRHAEAVADAHPGAAATVLLFAAFADLVALDPEAARRSTARAAVLAEAADDGKLIAAAQGLDTITATFDAGGPHLDRRLVDLFDLTVTAFHWGLPDAGTHVQLAGYALVMVDRAEEVVQPLKDVAELSDRTGFLGRSAFARCVRTEALWRLGRWDKALAESSQVVSMADATALRSISPYFQALMARVEACVGLGDECRRHAAAAESGAAAVGHDMPVVWARAALGLLALGEGRPGDAVEHFARVEDLAGHVRQSGWLWWEADAVEALLGAGRRDEAAAAAARLAERAAGSGSTWARAAAQRCGALLGERGPEAFDDALAGFRAIRAPFEEARTLTARGRRRLETGDDEGGHRDLDEAARIFDRLGARPWSRAVADAAADPAGTGQGLADRLSRAELRVALAVGGGLTNREAAEALFISTKTVEYHLYAIYRKLGLRNRAQLARLTAGQPATGEHAAIPAN